MQQVLFTVSYAYIDELIIDEGDKSVWQSSSKGQATAPSSGEELLELVITNGALERHVTPKPRQPLTTSNCLDICFLVHQVGNWLPFGKVLLETPSIERNISLCILY